MNKVARVPALIVLGVLLLQAAWILAMPPFRGIDEIDHSYRAAAVARGELIANDWAEDGRGLYVQVPRDIVAAAQFQCERLGYMGRENCRPTDGGAETVRAASGAGLYHPAFYWVVGTAALPFDGVTALYVMRVATALLCTLFLAAAAWAVTRGSSNWPVIGLVVALTPVFVYSTTVVAPNGVEMAAAAALWASLLALVRDPDGPWTGRLLTIGLVSATAVCTLRMLGPLFVLLIVACVAAYAPRALIEVVRLHRRRVVLTAGWIVLAALGAAGWVLSNQQTQAPEGPRGAGDVDALQLFTWNLQMIAAFPTRTDPGPIVIYPIVLILIGWLVSSGVQRGDRHARRSILGAIAVTLTLPLALTLLTMSGRGVIWQGRYVLPFSIGVLILAGFSLSQRQTFGGSRRFALLTAGLLAIGVSACLLKVRNDEIAIGSEPTWHQPPETLLVTLVFVAFAALAAAMSIPRTRDDRRMHARVGERERTGS